MRKIITTLAFALALPFVTFAEAKPAEADTLLASWYGPGFEGNLTCSGDVFHPYAFTAASLDYPQGTVLDVYYGTNVVRVVNDCGPYVGGRDIDLSQGTAEYLGLTYSGVDYVEAVVIR